MITPSPSYGQQRQLQVYTAGLQGQKPSLPVAPEDLEQAANEHMSREASGYLDGMAESMRANREAFRRWRIVPRMLRDVSQRDLSVRLFDLHLPTPILLKGILHPDDALHALDAGMDGIIVSNHGGRQVEGVRPSLDALPDIAAAVKGSIPLLFDSGIRRGSDAIKAIALGAKAVLLGRPYMWGLALAGEQGVREVLNNFLADLDLTLALSGYASFGELDASALARTNA